jgi:hypothetical protein
MNVILRHKAASAGGIAFLLVVIAVFAATALSSGGALSDSSSCSQWGAASPSQQAAYSRLYDREYVAAPSQAGDVGSIESAITQDCTKAAYLGESDDVSVIAAVKHQY